MVVIELLILLKIKEKEKSQKNLERKIEDKGD